MENQHSEIKQLLEIIISYMIPKFDESNYDVKGLQLEILRLCDCSNTINDISNKLKKSTNEVNKNLSLLRKKGLIKTYEINKKVYHGRTKWIRTQLS